MEPPSDASPDPSRRSEDSGEPTDASPGPSESAPSPPDQPQPDEIPTSAPLTPPMAPPRSGGENFSRVMGIEGTLPSTQSGPPNAPSTAPIARPLGGSPSQAAYYPPPAIPIKPPAKPAMGNDRIVSLDVLRGVALLGILTMNIQAFAMIRPAYVFPHALGELTGWNYIVWLAGTILARGKFLTIFNMLFGAGIVLMAERQRAIGRRAAGVHYPRMFVLLFIAMVHAYLIWDGDILYDYAVCGMAVFLVWRMRPSLLIIFGLLLFGLTTFNSWQFFLSSGSWDEDRLWWYCNYSHPPEDLIVWMNDFYHADWWSIFKDRVRSSWWEQTRTFARTGAWSTMGLMLLGMALYKLGVLTGKLRSRTYVWLLIGGLMAGLAMTITGIYNLEAMEWETFYTMMAGRVYIIWGAIPMALAWISLVMLACKHGWITWLGRCLASVGRMALTNYLAQSVLCTTIFYGYGLDLFGQLSLVEQLGVVLAIWILQMIWSPVWLSVFQFGPMEWFWRSCTYLRFQPVLRRKPKPAPASPAGPIEPGPPPM
jgi:uncharacterized protein